MQCRCYTAGSLAADLDAASGAGLVSGATAPRLVDADTTGGAALDRESDLPRQAVGRAAVRLDGECHKVVQRPLLDRRVGSEHRQRRGEADLLGRDVDGAPRLADAGGRPTAASPSLQFVSDL